MKQICRTIFAMLLLCLCQTAVCAAEPHLADEELIAMAVASNFPDADLGAKTGICAVILNRIDDPRFPDSAAGVISAENSGFDPLVICSAADQKSLRIAKDACRAAMSGSDPTGGLLHFDKLPEPSRRDNRPDFEAAADLSKYRIVIGNIGFY